jgi:hypothetical protein
MNEGQDLLGSARDVQGMERGLLGHSVPLPRNQQSLGSTAVTIFPRCAKTVVQISEHQNRRVRNLPVSSVRMQSVPVWS